MLPDKRSTAKRPAIMPPEEKACRARLKVLGGDFEEASPQASAEGCALPFPIRLKRLSATIDLEPDAVINCTAAEATVRFATTVITPTAKSAFGEELATIDQASAYVCRPRNGTRKLSEHAFGNALDIARFTLAGGSAIDVEPAPPGKNAEFLAAIRKAACGPFKTVLGPGSDADHSLHLHFDLAPRRNGGTFCK
ncbi:extensin family protein [Mesorhizobium sp. ANAO-SY3R2]|uniref:extensin-like domain-containing protein n=1 Tax=Mesorhizobium sp. ANAO-SY3R2 TaxID=3166644 RepID=UPI00366D9CAB